MSDQLRPSDSGHPDDLLAGIVDGTLTAAERADLQAHLDGCERCRAEVPLAEQAARALRELPELDAPWGLGREAIEESRKGMPGPRSRRFVAAAGGAAAAIVLVGLAIGVLRGPQAHDSGPAPTSVTAPQVESGGSSDRAASKQGDQFVSRERKNYDGGAIESLAASFAEQAHHAASPGPAAPMPSSAPATESSMSGTTGAGGATSAPHTSGTKSFNSANADTGESYVSCIDRAAGYDAAARPVHVIVARFEEKPALIGIFLHNPGAGQPADLVVVWVSSRQCEFLHYASHRISP
jgi:hypothetical protein